VTFDPSGIEEIEGVSWGSFERWGDELWGDVSADGERRSPTRRSFAAKGDLSGVGERRSSTRRSGRAYISSRLARSSAAT
jgi:hypothetical protein